MMLIWLLPGTFHIWGRETNKLQKQYLFFKKKHPFLYAVAVTCTGFTALEERSYHGPYFVTEKNKI